MLVHAASPGASVRLVVPGSTAATSIVTPIGAPEASAVAIAATAVRTTVVPRPFLTPVAECIVRVSAGEGVALRTCASAQCDTRTCPTRAVQLRLRAAEPPAPGRTYLPPLCATSPGRVAQTPGRHPARRHSGLPPAAAKHTWALALQRDGNSEPASAAASVHTAAAHTGCQLRSKRDRIGREHYLADQPPPPPASRRSS